jgi:molybdopterin synthase sulfur carrier subunit
MTITIRYFASLREALGAGESLELPAGTTVGQLRGLLRARGEPHAQVLAPTRALRCALNKTMCGEDAVIADDAEVAFFPPVTGG